MGRKLSVNGKFNVFMFLSWSALFISLSVMEAAGYPVKLFRDISAVLLCGVAVAVNYSMPRKVYLRSNTVNIWVCGLILWMMWCSYEFLTGLVELTDISAMYKLCIAIGLTLTFFFSARIVAAYDLKLPYLKMMLLILGVIILVRYFTHFDGLAFTSRIATLFYAGGRYRNDYGFKQVNHAGFAGVYFIIFSILYRTAEEEQRRKNNCDVRVYLHGAHNITADDVLDRFTHVYSQPGSLHVRVLSAEYVPQKRCYS